MNFSAADAGLLLEVVGMNLLLSGDNAIVVAMTVRNLRDAHRRVAAGFGIVAAVLLQIAATLTIAELLRLPIVPIAAGILLLFIAIRLLHENSSLRQTALPYDLGGGLLRSTLKVIGIYLAMSPDNVLAIAAAGRGHPWLLGIGILLSSAAIVPASLIVADLIKRSPLILTAGAALVGWSAGSMLAAQMPLGHLPGRQITPLLIPALITLAVLTSPFWYPAGNTQPRPLGPDCKLRSKSGTRQKT